MKNVSFQSPEVLSNRTDRVLPLKWKSCINGLIYRLIRHRARCERRYRGCGLYMRCRRQWMAWAGLSPWLRCILYTHVRVGLSPRLPIASDTINNQPAMSVSVFGCTVKGRFALSPLALREHEFAHPFVRTLRGYSQLFCVSVKQP